MVEEVQVKAGALAPDPKWIVVTFVILTVAFTSVFWYIVSQTPLVAKNAGILTFSILAAMWCPAAAAIMTRLVWQRNLAGFGFKIGGIRWWLLGIILPIAMGALMFDSAWITGIAPFNTDKVAILFSVAGLLAILFGIALSVFAAAGEEIGWRGLLVPELARFSDFTQLALISGVIWTTWHFPLIFFGPYHGAGPVWYSLITFVPSVMGAAFILAWLRLRSGSIWPAVLFHGFWNYFIQQFYPAITRVTEAGQAMLGEFGWLGVLVYIVLAILFWHFRDRLPKLPKPEGGL